MKIGNLSPGDIYYFDDGFVALILGGDHTAINILRSQGISNPGDSGKLICSLHPFITLSGAKFLKCTTNESQGL